jgi:hypothetical protein
MKIRGEWKFGDVSIPGFWIDDVASPDGKRFVATDHGWDKLRAAKCAVALSRCTLRIKGCQFWTYLDSGELHHTGKHGRGHGGSWRDDRETAWTCQSCHQKAERERTGTRWARSVAAEG